MNSSISATNRSADALWAAVARLVGGEYELAGELSASADGRRAAYIATRRTPARELALLIVERGAEPEAYELSFHEVLDESVPARDLYCRHCGHHLETWAANCGACGRNTALATAISRGQVSDLSIRSAIASALGAESTPLGQLPTASGSIAVFARTARTGEIVALTLERIGGASGPTRAVPLVRLQRHDTPTSVPIAPALPVAPAMSVPPPASVTPKRASSPHSGELGPLPERDRSLMTTVPGEPAVRARVCPRCGSRFEAGARFCAVDGAELREAGAHDDLVGQVVNGKFRVEKLLGQGGMGRVYLAEHVRIGRRCALKVLAPNLVGDPRSVRRFDGEARNASRIVHPSVAVVYDFEETPDGLVYLVLEYVDGETLGAILGHSENQRLDVTRAMRIAREVADALQAAHDLGIVHRDLKPDNIMITPSDRVKVVDFGIAKAMERAGEAAPQGVTRTGFVVGTPRYMSPEQIVGKNVDARTDIYALGCVLYEMVTGRAAYDAPTTAERAVRQPRFREDAPRALDALITKAMSRTADGRFQSAREMRDALDALLAGGRARSRRALFTRLLLGVAVLAVAAAAAVAIVSRAHTSAPTAPAPAALLPSLAPVVAAAPSAAQTVAPTVTPQAAPPVPVPSAPPTPAAGRGVQYLLHVKRVITEEWSQALQGYRPNGSERAEFTLALDETGRVLQVTPIAVSKQAAYDDPAESSLRRIVTFGPLPPQLSRDIRVQFRGSGLTVKAGNVETPTGPIH